MRALLFEHLCQHSQFSIAWLRLLQRRNAVFDEHIQIASRTQLFGQPFEIGRDHLGLPVLQKLLEQRECRAQSSEAYTHLMHAFRIALAHRLLIPGEMAQAGQTDGRERIGRRLGRVQEDDLRTSSLDSLSLRQRVTALGFGPHAVPDGKLFRQSPREHDNRSRVAIFQFEFEFTDPCRPFAGPDVATINCQFDHAVRDRQGKPDARHAGFEYWPELARELSACERRERRSLGEAKIRHVTSDFLLPFLPRERRRPAPVRLDGLQTCPALMPNAQ